MAESKTTRPPASVIDAQVQAGLVQAQICASTRPRRIGASRALRGRSCHPLERVAAGRHRSHFGRRLFGQQVAVSTMMIFHHLAHAGPDLGNEDAQDKKAASPAITKKANSKRRPRCMQGSGGTGGETGGSRARTNFVTVHGQGGAWGAISGPSWGGGGGAALVNLLCPTPEATRNCPRSHPRTTRPATWVARHTASKLDCPRHGAPNSNAPPRGQSERRGGRIVGARAFERPEQLVAQATVRDDRVAPGRHHTQLGAQGLDVGVDGAVDSLGVDAPDGAISASR